MTGRRWRWAVAAVCVAAQLVAGCADGGSVPDATSSSAGGRPTPLGVAEALAAPEGATVTVRGFVVASGGVTVLAEMLAETHPPQAGGAQVEVVGLDVGALDGTDTVGDVTWTSDRTTVVGTMRGGTLAVE